jgi:glutathione S-transferase
MQSSEYVVHGLHPSFFTRKVTGYLDYKRLPWWLSPDAGSIPHAREAGWPGGIPVVETPDGGLIWDSTSVILHLDTQHTADSVTPPGTLAFLNFLIDDFVDEWLYRPAIGTRWHNEENRTTGSWEIAREASYNVLVPAEILAQLDEPPPPPTSDAIRAFVTAAMGGAMDVAGVTAENIWPWMSESVEPFQRALDAHFDASPFLFGERPALGDFGIFGAHMAHFANDPAARRRLEEVAPGMVRHTQDLATSRGREFGDWADPDSIPDTLIDVIAELGRHYLPWVAEAAVEGAAEVTFGDVTSTIEATEFVKGSRAVLLARYAEARTPELDAVLERAGVLPYLADHLEGAGSIPDPERPPQPTANWPYPAIPS